jgi:hypothetical protein
MLRHEAASFSFLCSDGNAWHFVYYRNAMWGQTVKFLISNSFFLFFAGGNASENKTIFRNSLLKLAEACSVAIQLSSCQ